MSNPTEAQRRAKQRFWRRLKKQGTAGDLNKLSNIQIARLAGDSNLTTYLADPDFHDWFLNENTEADLIKAGAEGAIRCLVDIISGTQEVKSATAQVAAAKILLDMGGYGPKSSKEIAYKDEQIGKMSEDELRDYIHKQSEGIN